MFREMRRKKCVLKTETAEKILREGSYGVLALTGDDSAGEDTFEYRILRAGGDYRC